MESSLAENLLNDDMIKVKMRNPNPIVNNLEQESDRGYVESITPSTFRKRIRRSRPRIFGLFVTLAVICIIIIVITLRENHSTSQSKLKKREFEISYGSRGVVGSKAGIATDVAECSAIGKNILSQGGSAVDAAIAASICVGAVNFFANGIGGGGYATIRTPDGQVEFVDFRETAPASSDKWMYYPLNKYSAIGARSVAIPGEVKGYELMWKKYHKLDWSELLSPTIDLMDSGFSASSFHAARAREDYAYNVRHNPEWHSLIYPQGRLISEGDTIKRPNLARTLEKIAKGKSAAFYRGELADQMVRKLRGLGANITKDDFMNYEAHVTKPTIGKYRNFNVYTTAGSSSGMALIAGLNYLNKFAMSRLSTDSRYHILIEAMKWASSARTRLGDPEFQDAESLKDTMQIISDSFATKAKEKTSMHETYNDASHYGPYYDVPLNHGTTHVSVIDEDNMIVSITTSINTAFGSQVMDEETGIIFNNEMADFSTPGTNNVFDLKPSPHNYIEPGKRPLSSMVSTILIEDTQDDPLMLAIGGSGGSKILTSVMKTISDIIDFQKPLDQAINDFRIHNQLYPMVTEAESTMPFKVRHDLEAKGHQFVFSQAKHSTNNVLAVTKKGQHVVAKSDPRKSGEADAF